RRELVGRQQLLRVGRQRGTGVVLRAARALPVVQTRHAVAERCRPPEPVNLKDVVDARQLQLALVPGFGPDACAAGCRSARLRRRGRLWTAPGRQQCAHGGENHKSRRGQVGNCSAPAAEKAGRGTSEPVINDLHHVASLFSRPSPPPASSAARSRSNCLMSSGRSSSRIMLGPSLSARSGSGCVSKNTPSQPQATAARARNDTILRCPPVVCPPGSCTLCVASKMT